MPLSLSLIRSDNYIELVEAYYPPKDLALSYYYDKSSRPPRSARVVINFGGDKVPTTKNFVVSPIGPIGAETTIRLLDEIYHRPIIPHNARTMQPRELMLKFVKLESEG